MARKRRLDCPAGGYKQVRTDRVNQQFGDILRGLAFPDDWKDLVRQQIRNLAGKMGTDRATIERQKKRLLDKKDRLIILFKEGHISRTEFDSDIAAIALTLHQLDAPAVEGVGIDEVIAAGEQLSDMAALWDAATAAERREMVTLLLQQKGLHYDLHLQMIAAIQPRPVFLPVMRLLQGMEEQENPAGVFVSFAWLKQKRKEISPPHPSHEDEAGSDGGTDGIRTRDLHSDSVAC